MMVVVDQHDLSLINRYLASPHYPVGLRPHQPPTFGRQKKYKGNILPYDWYIVSNSHIG